MYSPARVSAIEVMYSSLWLDTLFVASAAVLWFMIVYQLLLFINGYLYSRRDAWIIPSSPRIGLADGLYSGAGA